MTLESQGGARHYLICISRRGGKEIGDCMTLERLVFTGTGEIDTVGNVPTALLRLMP